MSIRFGGGALLALFISLATPGAAQPVVSNVVHAATNRLRQYPLAGVAQGSLAVAYGTGLGPAQLIQVSSFPLTKSLGGTSITITVAGTTVDALMIYSFATQVAFLVPSQTPVGAGSVRVAYNGQTSASAPIDIVATNVGIYTWAEDGNGQAVATDGITNQVIRLEAAAKSGEVLNIWSNGLGAVTGDE